MIPPIPNNPLVPDDKNPPNPHPELSRGDVPFTHPFENDVPFDPVNFPPPPFGNFGRDFNFNIAPDPPYVSLLAPSNKDLGKALPDYDLGNTPWIGLNDYEMQSAVATANGPKAMGGLDLHVEGILHVEVDQGLIPEEYRPQHGDRVAVFGRWIVDAGHGDFHTEIHPPLLIATARPHTDGTHSTLIGRPYLVSQIFYFVGTDPGGLYKSLVDQLDYAGHYTAGIRDLDLNPHVLAGWAGSLSVVLDYIVRPSTPRNSDSDQLIVKYHFIGHKGVSVCVLNAGHDAVQVRIAFDNRSYTPPTLPPSGGKRAIVHVKDLGDGPEVAKKVDFFIENRAPAGAIRDNLKESVKRGASMTWYPRQSAISHTDKIGSVEIPVDNLPTVEAAALECPSQQLGNMTVDNTQPFPVFGFLDVYWKH